VEEQYVEEQYEDEGHFEHVRGSPAEKVAKGDVHPQRY
jgi:hypothetical protein